MCVCVFEAILGADMRVLHSNQKGVEQQRWIHNTFLMYRGMSRIQYEYEIDIEIEKE